MLGAEATSRFARLNPMSAVRWKHKCNSSTINQFSSCVPTVRSKCPMRADRCWLLFCDLAHRGSTYRDRISHLSLCPAPCAPCLLDGGRDRTNVSDISAAVKLVRFQKFDRIHPMVPNVSGRRYRTIEGTQSGETGNSTPPTALTACLRYFCRFW